MSGPHLAETLAGTYDCSVKTPMGPQSGSFTVEPGPDGTSFTGVLANDMGTLEVQDGRIEGNRLVWQMDMRKPVPMTLACEAVIEDGVLKGSAKAGVFGKMPISGIRAG